jgi:hypothetical protein
LVVLAAGCSSKPAAPAHNSSAPVDETVAPQVIPRSGVSLTISPVRVSSGAVRVQTALSGVARAWTAAHAWLDVETSHGWETKWLLDTDAHSISLADFRKGGTPLNALGIKVPATLQLTLSPAPPSGRYRLRLAVFSAAPESQAGAVPAWALGTIEIV